MSFSNPNPAMPFCKAKRHQDGLSRNSFLNHNKVQEPSRAPKSRPHPRETKIKSAPQSRETKIKSAPESKETKSRAHQNQTRPNSRAVSSGWGSLLIVLNYGSLLGAHQNQKRPNSRAVSSGWGSLLIVLYYGSLLGLGLGLGFGLGLDLDMVYRINFELAKTVEWFGG
eukprot:sb/3472286/